jgi:hypothetical protein
MHHSSLDSISILQHSSHDFDDVIGEGLGVIFHSMFPSNYQYHLSSQHVGYVKCGPREIFLDNEALWFQPMVMSGSHCLSSTPGMNDATHTETLSQGTLHTNFIYGSHQVCHSF